MKKDAYYFSHDSNATNDPKIMLMLSKWGLEAYGIFWTIIEHLREQPRYRSHVSILKALANRYGSTEEKYQYVVFDFGLFEIIDDEFFFSRSLTSRMKHLEKNREQRRVAGIKSGEARRQKALQMNGCSTDVERISNGTEQVKESKVKESKVKESKVKESKVEYIYNEFYDNQIKIDPDNEGYKNLVKFIFGENESGTPLTNVLKMKTQLTMKEGMNLLQKQKETGVMVGNLLYAMDNRPTLAKDYSSVYKTCLNWLKNEYERKSKWKQS